jgi:hypothetical protein
MRIKASQRDDPREFRITGEGAAQIAAAAGEEKLATFEGTAYTGAPMRPEGWWQPVIIDLDGVKIPSQHRPALRQHDHEQIVGHTTSVKASRDGIEVKGVFSGQEEHVDKVVKPARNGFQWQLSVGANPIRSEFLEAGKKTIVNGRQITGPMTISRETEVGEISFVPLGADGKTSATVAASKGNLMNPFQAALKELMTELRAAGKLELAKYSEAEIDKMTADEARASLKKCMKAGDDEEDEDEDEDEKPKKKAKSKATATLQAEADDVMASLRRDAAAEHVRQAAITAAVNQYGVTHVEIEENGAKRKVNLTAHAIAENWAPERAELLALRAARPGPGVGIAGGLGYSTTTPGADEAVIEAAILHATRHQFLLNDDSFYNEPTPDGKGSRRRVPQYVQAEAQGTLRARYTDQVQQAAHTLFKGRIGLQQIFRACLGGDGASLDLRSEVGIRSMMSVWDHQTIRAEGSSNLSISNILANVLNKFALQGYLFTEQAWRDFCAIRPVNDFKPVKSINLLGDVMYKQLGPSGELENASLGDQAFANVAAPFGRILTLPWTHIVNDDLSMLTGAPQKIGQGAGLALNDNIWTLWKNMAAGTVNGDDGNAFWRTTSSTTSAAMRAGTAYKPNKTSGGGSALQPSSLQTVKALFDNQIDPNGNPLGFDGVQPVLLFGPSNWQTATALLQAAAIVYGGASTSLQPDKNVWQGYCKPVLSRYIENANYVNSATAWWILFNPVALAVIEVCFLNGVDTPAVLTASPDYQFDKLGISIRGTMPFGSNQQNFRGGVYAVGA